MIEFLSDVAGLSDCLVAAFARADADAFVHGEHEDLAVADVACARALADAFDGGLDELVVDRDREADLLQQVDFLKRAAPHVDVSALLAAAQRVRDGDFEDAAGVKRLLDGIQPVGLDVRDDQFHIVFLLKGF